MSGRGGGGGGGWGLVLVQRQLIRRALGHYQPQPQHHHLFLVPAGRSARTLTIPINSSHHTLLHNNNNSNINSSNFTVNKNNDAWLASFFRRSYPGLPRRSLASPTFGRPFLTKIERIQYPSLYPRSAAMASRSFWSRSQNQTDQPPLPPPPAPDPPAQDITVVPKELMEVANSTANSLKEAATAAVNWLQDTADSLLPLLREKFDFPEYSSETGTQLVYTSIATLLAWFVMPRLFRMLHRYFEDGSYILLRRTEKIPYELSFWASLEDPARSFITVVAFTQLASLIAPTTIASQYLGQIWKGTAVIALVWFSHRWKSNFLSRILANKNLATAERERILTLDKISSMGLFILGGMGVAETCGIAAQSILTVGGIGGVATAFAAKDILGNVLSGFALQFMRPFSIGDIIKAGSIEGQVLDIGLTATQLLDNDKYPVAVPNSYFSSQVIVNKSRAPWRAFNVKIPVQVKDFDKIPQITQEVRNMLKSHPRVMVQPGLPHCFVSRAVSSMLEITVLCNITLMGKEDLPSTEQEIILEVLKIVTQAGATVGVTFGHPAAS